MLYRSLKGNPVSILSFGAMRLPLIGGTRVPTDSFDPARSIDEEEMARMIGYAIEHGINYFDTSYVYHGGKSEAALGKFLKPYRDRVLIATKLPVFLVRERDHFGKILSEQLAKLQTDYLDFYLLHGLNAQNWRESRELGVLDFLDQIKRDGRVKHVGFSFHDTLSVFKDIVDSYDWDVCQIQYNYLDEKYQAGSEGLRYAASKNLGVVVMEPLRGGKLVKVPAEVLRILESSPIKMQPAQWGLRWIWNHPEVATVLSGMSNLDQVKENIGFADEGTAGSLSAEQLATIGNARNAYRSLLKLDCTGCAYCMPCPSGVDIPLNFTSYNDLITFKDPTGVMRYTFMSPEH